MRISFFLVLLVGCGPARLPGAPLPGDACAGDAPVCMTRSSMGSCVEGKWREWDCKYECSNASKPPCEKAPPTLGEACPASFDGVGVVACAEDGKSAIGCRAGKWAQVTCPACKATDSGFTCG